MQEILNAQTSLDKLCKKVSLHREAIPVTDDAFEVPFGTTFWSSDYACLLLWPVTDPCLPAFQESSTMALDFLDGILSNNEKTNKHLDGYLVLALKDKPMHELDTEVRNLELSTNICRKHIIWLDSKEKPIKWARISDISVLGLPEIAPQPSEILTWPIMESDVKALWLEIGAGVVKVPGDNI